jgi:hypothetical protein
LAETTAYTRARFEEARSRSQRDPTDPQAANQLGQAAFEFAEWATNRAERAEIAAQGMAACRAALALSNSASAHYYLGLDMGEMARTKGLGALKLVSAMCREFEAARLLDERIHFAGPDRNLGQIYRDAPSIISVGDRAQAEQHLRRAVRVAPLFPDNHLELIEGFIKWDQLDNGRKQIQALEAAWPEARAQLTGPAWAASWADWEKQFAEFKKKIGLAPPLRPPRNKD